MYWFKMPVSGIPIRQRVLTASMHVQYNVGFFARQVYSIILIIRSLYGVGQLIPVVRNESYDGLFGGD